MMRVYFSLGLKTCIKIAYSCPYILIVYCQLLRERVKGVGFGCRIEKQGKVAFKWANSGWRCILLHIHLQSRTHLEESTPPTPCKLV